VLDVSWGNIEAVPKLKKNAIRGRCLTCWPPTGQLGKAADAELGRSASRFTVHTGEKEQAHHILSKFTWGEQFIVLNQEPLDRYAECKTSAEVVAVQADYVPEERMD